MGQSGDVQGYLQSTAARSLLRDIEEIRDSGRRYSDITDDAGHQYVDLVLEGGGMLGIALVGYTYALEQAGLRFLHIGGTSAGAINAFMLAAAGPPESRRSERLLPLLDATDFRAFVDGPPFTQWLVDALVANGDTPRPGTLGVLWKLLWNVRTVKRLARAKGLNPGDAFLRWVRESFDTWHAEDALESGGAEAHERLFANLRAEHLARIVEPEAPGQPPRREPLRAPGGGPFQAELKLIAADISTETKAVFPQDRWMYWTEGTLPHPAVYVRASMSIPAFFQPLRVAVERFGSVERQRERMELWKDTGYRGPLPPKHALFVDGGVLSNFPIDEFHVADRIPTRPTFGVKLGEERDGPQRTASLPSYLFSVFNAARHLYDYTFLRRHEDYNHLIARISTKQDGRDINWLDFGLGQRKRETLFINGIRAAVQFLREFRWDHYKALRESRLSTAQINAEMKHERKQLVALQTFLDIVRAPGTALANRSN